jgi:hypothetical protein
MSSTLSLTLLREQAIELRRAGKSRRQINEIRGIGSNRTLNYPLQGEPLPEWTLRPNAKDDVRAVADVVAAERFWLEVTGSGSNPAPENDAQAS